MAVLDSEIGTSTTGVDDYGLISSSNNSYYCLTHYTYASCLVCKLIMCMQVVYHYPGTMLCIECYISEKENNTSIYD